MMLSLNVIIFKFLKMRTIVDIPQDKLQHLDLWAELQKISRAEAVRRAVDDLLARVTKPRGYGFGVLAPANGIIAPEQDGLAIQRALRNEWPD